MRQKRMTQSKRTATAPIAPTVRDGSGALPRAQAQAAPALRRLLALLIGRMVLRLAAAGSMALLFGAVIMGEPVTAMPVIAALGLVLASLAAGLACDRLQADAEADAAVTLRNRLRDRLAAAPAGSLRGLSAGRAAVALQRHPEAVAALVIGHKAATAMMAFGPLLAAGALALVSWQAALLVLALTPIMILFFALVGGAIRARAQAQERSFGHLAAHFADRIRCLPTILGNDALAPEQERLAERLDAYVARTMSVLRLAFLNAGLIDFFASLSIAMLALFLGLGHLGLPTMPGFAHLSLWQSLFILMLAPEYFAPFRRFSEQYHAKAEGLAAAEGLDALLVPAPAAPALPQVDRALAEPQAWPAQGLVVVSGQSGAGKSTLLRRLAGIEQAGEQTGHLPDGPRHWVGTDSVVDGRTVAEAIGRDAPMASPERVAGAAAQIGLLDDALLPGGLAAEIAPGGANLSGGQRLRIAVARALLGTGCVIADEPTAKLDAGTARLVRAVLREIAHTRLVAAASHDPALIALADRHVALGAALDGIAA